MRCPVCGSQVRVHKTGQLMQDERTGLLVCVRLVECPKCGRGKDVVSHDLHFYDLGLPVDPTPLSPA